MLDRGLGLSIPLYVNAMFRFIFRLTTLTLLLTAIVAVL